MALITLRQLLDHAAEQGYGVPAFNINNMEQGLAILKAAQSCDAPVILQASRGARSYAGDIMLRHMVQALAEMHPDIPIVLHQDHGNNDATCLSAIRHGFTSVMMDGSLLEDMKTPASYDYNVAITRRVTEAAHAVGASVEGELGVLGSLETGEAGEEDGSGAEGKIDHSMLLTDPDQAVDFVLRTRVDALAIACGTSHGAYKFSRKPDGDILSMKTIEAIHRNLPDTHLVMHGSSSVPQYLQDLINDAGGEMPQTYGVPVEEIVRGIKMTRAEEYLSTSTLRIHDISALVGYDSVDHFSRTFKSTHNMSPQAYRRLTTKRGLRTLAASAVKGESAEKNAKTEKAKNE